ncbi:S-adenosylmethionine tRNA ribosyltransferase [Shewanella mangrovi]|uniref:S-adenosylmethionine tRNA ribosyltransferase n=1 Tax=Shewanella mangrovi TaxID=1515746 RepID=A0A094LS05_9GAMM|nr:PHP domain-containing protein [Shewanella mangrovi]KFZ37973.1 S-adenosylmethionine tRNA ribosyltransferase [Shewanella mangrovi]
MITEQTSIDLHCHSTASDGQLTPSQLVARAIEKGVNVLAITDHDTVAGLDEAHAFNASQPEPLTLIDGVEISTRWHAYDIHIVGLGVDRHRTVLLDFMENQRQLREERAREIGVRLEKAGIAGAYEGAKALAGDAAISRGHYARFMVEQGIVADMAKVFKKYLARGKTGYVPNNWGDMASAIELIHNAGGVAVLAHPSGYQLSGKWLKRLVNDFKAAGGTAMEVVLGQQSTDDLVQLAALANQRELFASVGSDFHFPGRWLELGRNLTRPKGLQWVWQSAQWKVSL